MVKRQQVQVGSNSIGDQRVQRQKLTIQSEMTELLRSRSRTHAVALLVASVVSTVSKSWMALMRLCSLA